MAEVWHRLGNCDVVHCAEVTYRSDKVGFRDSEVPDIVLWVGTKQWAEFIEGVRNGEFDLPELLP